MKKTGWSEKECLRTEKEVINWNGDALTYVKEAVGKKLPVVSEKLNLMLEL